ncbi:hypothetical protein HYDPIDRAFT_109785 [Hydnomerulius pinastri MD-312]|nr:hypothetical protein HYDPIDRAFT_109785 [Hydnomerulius pinastri MD-312]
MNTQGLYSFTTIDAWLRAIGVASPPDLVAYGLALPDARILKGIASIGLTLENIAEIAPHLRQSTHRSARTFNDADPGDGGDARRLPESSPRIKPDEPHSPEPQNQVDASPERIDSGADPQIDVAYLIPLPPPDDSENLHDVCSNHHALCRHEYARLIDLKSEDSLQPIQRTPSLLPPVEAVGQPAPSNLPLDVDTKDTSKVATHNLPSSLSTTTCSTSHTLCSNEDAALIDLHNEISPQSIQQNPSQMPSEKVDHQPTLSSPPPAIDTKEHSGYSPHTLLSPAAADEVLEIALRTPLPPPGVLEAALLDGAYLVSPISTDGSTLSNSALRRLRRRDAELRNAAAEGRAPLPSEHAVRRKKKRTKVEGGQAPSGEGASPDLDGEICGCAAPAADAVPRDEEAVCVAMHTPVDTVEADDVIYSTRHAPLPARVSREAARPGLRDAQKEARAGTTLPSASATKGQRKRGADLKRPVVERHRITATQKTAGIEVVAGEKGPRPETHPRVHGRATAVEVSDRNRPSIDKEKHDRRSANRLVAVDIAALPKPVAKDSVHEAAAESSQLTTSGSLASALRLKAAIQEYQDCVVDDVILIHSSVSAGHEHSSPSAFDEAAMHARVEPQTAPAQALGLNLRTPERLSFVPMSVVRRCPSVAVPSAGGHTDNGALRSAHDLGDRGRRPVVEGRCAVLDERAARTSAWAASAAREVRWRAPFVRQSENGFGEGPVVGEGSAVEGEFVGEEELVEEGILEQPIIGEEPFEEEELVTEKQTVMAKGPILEDEPIEEKKKELRRVRSIRSPRRLGVLGRAALRDRRRACRGGSDGSDNTLPSDSGSELDNDSHSASDASFDEDLSPKTLGSELVAALDADDGSEVDLQVYRKLPALSADESSESCVSSGDVSLIAHGPSNIGVSDGEMKVSPTWSSLNYGDIRQWAARVSPYPDKQDAVIEVRARARRPVIARPPSPSEASEACAERPSVPGISRCPLHGVVHGKVSTPARVVGWVPPLVLGRRDVVEFVPRRGAGVRCADGRGGSVQTRCSVQPERPVQRERSVLPQRPRTRSMMYGSVGDVASEVIARVETRAMFGAQSWDVGREFGR